MSNKLKQGDICYFDPLNKVKQTSDGTCVVKIINIKNHLFRKTSYETLSLQSGNIIKCNADILVKIDDGDEKERKVLFRLDTDNLPTITNSDIKALDDILSLMNDSAPDLKQRLIMLKTKLEYFDEIGDV